MTTKFKMSKFTMNGCNLSPPGIFAQFRSTAANRARHIKPTLASVSFGQGEDFKGEEDVQKMLDSRKGKRRKS